MKSRFVSLLTLAAITAASTSALADRDHDRDRDRGRLPSYSPGFPSSEYAPGPIPPGRGARDWRCGEWRHDGRDAFKDLRDQLEDMVQDGLQAQAVANEALRNNPDWFTTGRGVDLYLAIYAFTAEAQATYNIVAIDWSGRDQRADAAQAVDNLERSIQKIRLNNDKLALDMARLECDLQDVKNIVGVWGRPVPPPRPPRPIPVPAGPKLIQPAHNSASFTVNADMYIGVLISSSGVVMDPNNNDRDRRGRTRMSPGAAVSLMNNPALFPNLPGVGFVNVRNVQVTARGGRMVVKGAPMVMGNQISVTFEDYGSSGGSGSFVVTWDSDY